MCRSLTKFLLYNKRKLVRGHFKTLFQKAIHLKMSFNVIKPISDQIVVIRTIISISVSVYHCSLYFQLIIGWQKYVGKIK